MRAIINLASPRVIYHTGWRAREIVVDNPKTTLSDILKATPLKERGKSLLDLIADEHGLRNDYSLFISGEFFHGEFDMKRCMRDSEQIHIWDWPFEVRDS